MKTAVSIPDKLFERAEELAQRLGKSRSQVYREALAEYVARREPAAVTVALDELVAPTSGWPRPAAARSSGASGSKPRRRLLGVASGSDRLGTGLPPASCCRSRRRV